MTEGVSEVLLSHQVRSQRAQSQSALVWPDPPPLPLYIYTLSSQHAWGCSTPPRSLTPPYGQHTHKKDVQVVMLKHVFTIRSYKY